MQYSVANMILHVLPWYLLHATRRRERKKRSVSSARIAALVTLYLVSVMGHSLEVVNAYSRPGYHPDLLTFCSAFGTFDPVE